MFKPPKLFRTVSADTTQAPADITPPPPPPAQTTAPAATAESDQRVWSPTTEPPKEIPEVVEESVAEPTEITEVIEENTSNESKTPATESVAEPEEVVAEPAGTIQEEIKVTEEVVAPAPKNEEEAQKPEDDESRYARPVPRKAQSAPIETKEAPAEKVTETQKPSEETLGKSYISTAQLHAEMPEGETPDDAIRRLLGKDQKVVRAPSLNTIPFSDIWYTAEKIAYIRDKATRFALIPFESDDLEDFYKALEQGYTGQSSYSIRFAGEQYRVERIITMTGPQYNCRKMPGAVPDIYTLGLPKHVVDYLVTLSHESGLLLFGGPTGMGKTTSASALMKKFLEIEGGFMYTIEDPPEMPLDGLYHAENGGLGLCKQCPVDNERWGDGIKSALRSRPRYILVGEIRTPETASQVLRAATSGHLVLSTIHASTVEDSLESVIKYASGAGLTESLAADLLARGVLGVIHQKLEGAEVLRPVITAAFANPQLTGGDQMRSLIRNQTINLQTLIESQSSRLFQGRPLFGNEKID